MHAVNIPAHKRLENGSAPYVLSSVFEYEIITHDYLLYIIYIIFHIVYYVTAFSFLLVKDERFIMLSKSKDSDLESYGDCSGELENEDGQNDNGESELDRERDPGDPGDPEDPEDPENPKKDLGKKQD